MTPAQLAAGTRQRLGGLWHALYRTSYLSAAESMITAGMRVARARTTFVRRNQPGVPDSTVRAALASGDWQRERALPSVSDTTVIMVGAPQGETGALKVTTTASGLAGLRREHDVLSRLRSDERLGSWRALLPVPLDAGEVDGGAFLLTTRLPGRDGRHLPPAAVSRLTSVAIDAIAPLHRSDQTFQEVDTVLLTQWVDEPAERIRNAVRCNGTIDRLVGTLHAQLAGCRVTLGRTHGDFYPGNLLFSTGGRVTGIVDWSEAREQDLVVLDPAFWLLTVPTAGQPRAFGARVATRLDRDPCWTSAESRLLDTVTGGDVIAGRTLLLLAWLRHVASNLAKSDRYATSLLWSRRNIIPVLRVVADA